MAKLLVAFGVGDLGFMRAMLPHGLLLVSLENMSEW